MIPGVPLNSLLSLFYEYDTKRVFYENTHYIINFNFNMHFIIYNICLVMLIKGKKVYISYQSLLTYGLVNI